MTTRNFRVHNGISVGDVTISASTNKITGLSVSAPSADGDVATKKYVDDSLGELQSFRITAGNSDITITDTGSGSAAVNIDSTAIADFSALGLRLGAANSRVTTILDEDTLTSDSDTALATQQSIKAYVDNTLSSTLSNNGLSTGSVAIGNTSMVVTDTGSNGAITFTCDGNQELVINDDGIVINGNLTVNGTETIVDTQNLSIEDAIIGLNANVSDKNNMPRFSGLHLHRGTGSAALDQDLYFVWDDAFADDGTTIYGNAGGAFTAMRSTHVDGSETPNDDFDLVDMRCNILHATSTSAQYADIAERFAADAPMAEGAVVMLGGSQEITETTEDKSPKVFGVISTKPAYLMNAGAGNNESHPFVAMTGRTPVRVSGPVNKGDRLVSSSIKGTARAVADSEEINPFHVIGRALESKTDAGIGMVNCVVRTNN